MYYNIILRFQSLSPPLSIVELNGNVYMLGGCDKKQNSSKSVYRCPLGTILGALSALTSIDAQISKILSITMNRVRTPTWYKLADLPLTSSACVHVHGKLLAIGGMNAHGNSMTAIYVYNIMSFDKWELFGHMSIFLLNRRKTLN